MGVTWWCAFDWYSVQSGLQTMGIYSMDRKTMKKVGSFVQSTYKPYYYKGGVFTGINENSIRVEIDNKTRQVSIVPIIYRIM